MIGAREVLLICEGWLMVSQSNTTSCRARANSNILSISACTSTEIPQKYSTIHHIHLESIEVVSPMTSY